MGGLIHEREQVLTRRLDQMREMDEWHLFQNFTLGLLTPDGYTDVRLSNVRNDFGLDGVALTPDGRKCFVAVSFDCSLSKIRKDAKRWTEDPNREDAEVLLFITNNKPTNTKVSQWVAEVNRDYNLDLRLFNRETILSTATRESVWRETCARLGIPGYRQGYVKVAPYDTEVARRALLARPPEWLRQRVPLEQWKLLTDTVQSRLIFGKPGAGKTTTIFEQLERARPSTVLVVESDLSEASQIEALLDQAAGGAVIVYDDLHANHKMFVRLCQALLARRRDPEPRIARQYENVALLAATRSQEWQDIHKEIPLTILQDLGLLGEAEWTLSDLDVENCRRLIEICRDEWNLTIEQRLLNQGAMAAAERDATPLFVISMLAAARGRDDRTLRDEHLAGLPANIRDLWERYWHDLDADSQAVLRLVRLFWAAKTPPQPQLLNEAAKYFDLSRAAITNRLDLLERSLWLTRTAGVPACLDVQLESINLDDACYDLWDKFVFDPATADETRLQLHNGTGVFYARYVAPRTSVLAAYKRRREAQARHFDAVADLARKRDDTTLAAMARNNLSNSYEELATLETTHDDRRAWLDKAVAAGEGSLAIYRELGVRGDLARSLNNLSVRYSNLAGLETTREGRRAWLDKAVAAVKESLDICRELGLRGDLASSLNNLSNRYGDLASLETTREGRRAWLDKAVAAVEESLAIRRELGLRGDLAASLNNQSIRYRDLAELETTREGRRAWLDKAVAAVEESVAVRRELGVRGELASSLGSLCQHQRGLAETELEPEETARRLTLAREAIDEAVTLFRDAGNAPHQLIVFQEAVATRLLLAQSGVAPDPSELLNLIDEGLTLATSLRNDAAIDFFTTQKRNLTDSPAP